MRDNSPASKLQSSVITENDCNTLIGPLMPKHNLKFLGLQNPHTDLAFN